jgi:hypothetical protein
MRSKKAIGRTKTAKLAPSTSSENKNGQGADNDDTTSDTTQSSTPKKQMIGLGNSA